MNSPVLVFVLSAVVGYLLGSISFATVISKTVFKKDVRTLGSGNAGMTNILRNFGRIGAAITLLGDAGKGFLAVFVGRWLTALLAGGLDPLYAAYVGGIAAILGHMFPVFFGFKGGKGVSVSAGVILALQPILMIPLVLAFLLIVYFGRMVSLGSIIGISLYPVFTLVYTVFFTHRLPVYSTICAVIIAGLVVWMHRSNIERIRTGKEYKFGQKKPEPDPATEGTAPESLKEAIIDED